MYFIIREKCVTVSVQYASTHLVLTVWYCQYGTVSTDSMVLSVWYLPICAIIISY